MTSFLPRNSHTSTSSLQSDDKTASSGGAQLRRLMTLVDYAERQCFHYEPNQIHQYRMSSIDEIDRSLLHKQHTTSSNDSQQRDLITTAEYMEQQHHFLPREQFTISSGDKHERPHMTLAEYAQRRCLRHAISETGYVRTSSIVQQHKLLRRREFTTASDDEHQAELVTLARRVELNGLDPKLFEMDELLSSPLEQQNILHKNPPFRTPSDNKHDIRIIRMAEYMREQFMYQQGILPLEPQFTTSSDDKHKRSLMTLAEYAQRRRLRHELPEMDSSRTSLMKQHDHFLRRLESTASCGDVHDRHHINLVAYARRKCWHRRLCEMNQSRASSTKEQLNLLPREQSITSSSDEHQEEFVTLAHYIELKGLDPEWFEIDKVTSTTLEQQDIPLQNKQNTEPSGDEDNIRLIRMESLRSQSMNDIEPINRNSEYRSMLDVGFGQLESVKVLSVDQCVLMHNRYESEKSKTNAYVVKRKCRILKIFSRSSHVSDSQNRAKYGEDEPTKGKRGLLARIGCDMFRCFRQDHMQETPICYRRNVV
jgi:hypothetical protein